MKISITKPYWHQPIEDEVESVTITKQGSHGMLIEVKGGKDLGDGSIGDTQLEVRISA